MLSSSASFYAALNCDKLCAQSYFSDTLCRRENSAIRRFCRARSLLSASTTDRTRRCTRRRLHRPCLGGLRRFGRIVHDASGEPSNECSRDESVLEHDDRLHKREMPHTDVMELLYEECMKRTSGEYWWHIKRAGSWPLHSRAQHLTDPRRNGGARQPTRRRGLPEAVQRRFVHTH